MPLDSVIIETLKKHLDNDTYISIVNDEASRKASIFKYRLNATKNPYNENKFYLQLKGTIGYNNKKKLWVSHSIGSATYAELKAIDKSELYIKYESLMKDKAKDAILKEFLK